MSYSIIIPIFNEFKTLEQLLEELKVFHSEGNEIIIINDGSTDGTLDILENCNYINLINLNKNSGKGFAFKEGLSASKNKKIVVYDGDLELRTEDISSLMQLNVKTGIDSIMGFRFKQYLPFKSSSNWGNFIFTTFFNLLNNTCHKDILCCAKSFYKKDIPIDKIKSKYFDIDVELTSFLSKNNRGKKIKQVFLEYSRRSVLEGKKLKIKDGWKILKRIIFEKNSF